MAKERMDIEKKKVITPEFRVSFPAVFEAKSFEDQPPKFSLVMLFDKKTDLASLKKAAFNAAVEQFGPKEKWPKNLRFPFRDGNEKADQMGYKDTIFVTASNKNRPGVVDQKRQRINAEDETFYAGCYARAEIIAFGYDKLGNKGVGFSLQNIQKTKDGEPFSGRKAPEDVFEDIDDGSDNSEAYQESSLEGF